MTKPEPINISITPDENGARVELSSEGHGANIRWLGSPAAPVPPTADNLAPFVADMLREWMRGRPTP